MCAFVKHRVYVEISSIQIIQYNKSVNLQIANFRTNETVCNFIERSNDYIKEMDKVEDKVLKWTQTAEEASAKRK